ncbi:MAG: hypothetical protein QW806_10140 [Nitrososphaerota archaeon]
MFYQFYNTKTGTVMLDYTSRGTASFSFARSLNPNVAPNQITKGMKMYDYQNMQHFSLTLDEALLVANLLEKQVAFNNGTIEAGIKQMQQNQNQNPVSFYEIVVTHFPGSKEQKMQGMKSVSKLSIRVNANLSGSLYLYKDNFTCSVPFGPEGYFILISFLKNLPTFIAQLTAYDVSNKLAQRQNNQDNQDRYNNYPTQNQNQYVDNRPYSANLDTQVPPPPPIQQQTQQRQYQRNQQNTNTFVSNQNSQFQSNFGMQQQLQQQQFQQNDLLPTPTLSDNKSGNTGL